MNPAAVKIGVGGRLLHDRQVVQIVEVHPGRAGMDLVLKDPAEADHVPGKPQRTSWVRGNPGNRRHRTPINDDPAEPAGILLGHSTRRTPGKSGIEPRMFVRC